MRTRNGVRETTGWVRSWPSDEVLTVSDAASARLAAPLTLIALSGCGGGGSPSVPLCVPKAMKACQACTKDFQCPGGRCVTVDGAGRCAVPWREDGTCGDASYRCEKVSVPSTGDPENLCLPATGTCSCDGTNPGFQKVCQKEAPGAVTTCYGTMTCTVAGWGDCGMPDESCNLVDDDCDGETDEGFRDASGQYSSDENCGKCGNNCTLLVFGNAHGVCNSSVTPFRCGPQCDPGFFDLDDNPNDCECHYLSATDFPGQDVPSDPQALDVNCDGVDGEVDNAVFVAKNGDDANPGTREAPKRTIHAGIDAAALAGLRDVYVATGVYQEAVVLARDVGVYGGYSSDFRVRDLARYETAILAPMPSDAIPGAVNGLGVTGGLPGRTVLDGFTVFAYAEKRPGRSSYGVTLADCDDSVRISHNVLHGGSGGPGQRGSDGADGTDGVSGSPGVAAFDLYETIQQTYGVSVQHCEDLDGLGIPRPVSPGGPGGVSQCGAVNVSGGAGGNRICPAWDSVLDRPAAPVGSEYGAAGTGPGAAAGGAPGQDVFHQAYSCDGYSSFGSVEGGNGSDGAPGTDGQSGAGCVNASGLVLGGLWFPATAGNGTSGGPGGGGGGGGSGAGAWVHTSCFAKGFGYDNFGGSGGGGGSGGCQGTAGTAGTGGGGAFTVFVTFSSEPGSLPALASNVVTSGYGGPGGDGGNGGVGGTGGPGAQGGAGGGSYNPSAPTYPSFRGSKGGQGGRGGPGGGGGGGCGGPSYGIFANGVSGAALQAWKTLNTFQVSGAGGSGGDGGFSLGEPGGDGLDGPVAATNF